MRVVMMGTGTFAEPTLEALLARPGLVVGVVTQPDKQAGEKRDSTRQVGRGMKEIARRHVPSSNRRALTRRTGRRVETLEPELVVAAYDRFFPRGAERHHWAHQIHASLLPGSQRRLSRHPEGRNRVRRDDHSYVRRAGRGRHAGLERSTSARRDRRRTRDAVSRRVG